MRHPDTMLTPQQRATIADYMTRIDAALTGNPFNATILSRFRRGFAALLDENDRGQFRGWFGDYRALIDSELSSAERYARAVRRAA